MKRLIYLSLAALMMVAAVSCNKDDSGISSGVRYAGYPIRPVCAK